MTVAKTIEVVATEAEASNVIFDFDKQDCWPAETLGITPDYTHSMYNISFTRIQITWLKIAAKKFIKLQSATKSFSTCMMYIKGLQRFDAFLRVQPRVLKADEINRKVIIDYLHYLATSNLSVSTRQLALTQLSVFQRCVVQEAWLPWPEYALIFNSDRPKKNQSIPRFIPETVLCQLEKHLIHLPDYIQRFIIILRETGRRISEICRLPINCLEQDNEGDWLLIVTETKFKQTRFLPISLACYNAIIKQKEAVLVDEKFEQKDCLFPARYKGCQSKYMGANIIKSNLNKLAETYDITDDNHQRWRFQSHQFRHTIGTRMINSGVPQVLVQKYLGHKSPEMTARYAHIHDATLKTAFNEYQTKLINIHGEQCEIESDYKDAVWLKKNIVTQALPNGLCALPIQQQCCPHANACLSCGHFRTNKRHLAQHKAQLVQTIHFISQAKEKGLTRQVEMNEGVKNNLEKIIHRLEESKNEST